MMCFWRINLIKCISTLDCQIDMGSQITGGVLDQVSNKERPSYLAILGHFRGSFQIFYVSRIVLIFVEGPVRSEKLMQDKVFSDKGGGKLHRSGKGGFLDKGEKAS